MSALDPKARRHLRALGHHRKPVVLIGKGGVTDGVLAALSTALGDHELIKIKLSDNTEGERHALAETLAEGTKSELVGVLGRTALFYKRHPKQPKIALPKASKAKVARKPTK